MTDPSLSWSRIPMPSLLTNVDVGDVGNRDPHRSGDAGPIYEGSGSANDESEALADYARKLWAVLDQAAEYLLEQVARGGSGPVLARPESLLTTEEQWQHWCEIYAAALSVLAGPVGDEGYGAQEARLEYQNRWLYKQ